MHAPRKEVQTPAQRVHDVLLKHRGRAQAITALKVCRELRWGITQTREVRSIIEDHANSEWPGLLCAIPGVGYFFATDLEEIATYRQYLVCLSNAAQAKVRSFDARVKAEGFSLKGVAI